MENGFTVSNGAGSEAMNTAEYLTKAANWLNEIAAKLGPCSQVNEIKRISNSIRNYKLWVDSYVDLVRNEHHQALEDLKRQFGALRIEVTPPDNEISSDIKLEDSNKAQILVDQKDQVYEEPDWKPLEFDIHCPEVCEKQEAAMVRYLEEKKGINDGELHAWVMLATGAVVDSKNPDYLAMNLKQVAFARGGQTLVNLLEFETAYQASKEVYRETAYEWNVEQAEK